MVVATVALLVGLLLPALGRAREAGRAVQCAGNTRQLGTGWEAAMVDAGMVIPRTVNYHLPGATWYDAAADGMYGHLRPGGLKAWLECATRASEGDIVYGAGRMFSYAVNTRWRPGGPWGQNEGQRWDELQSPARYAWLAEPAVLPSGNVPLTKAYFGAGPADNWGLGAPHDGRLNLGYADGHVARVSLHDFGHETDGQGVPLWLFDR